MTELAPCPRCHATGVDPDDTDPCRLCVGDGTLDAAELVAERDRYRDALAQIAGDESGIWGRIAHEALHPRRAA